MNRLIGPTFRILVLCALSGCDAKSVDTSIPTSGDVSEQIIANSTTESLQEPPFDFLGEWHGRYGCKALGVEPLPDTLEISEGELAGNYVITLHATSENPSVVSGTLLGSSVIKVAEQVIAGATGTVEIRGENGTLIVVQRGLGLTCEGTYQPKTP
jgi:hypothetical protein